MSCSTSPPWIATWKMSRLAAAFVMSRQLGIEDAFRRTGPQGAGDSEEATCPCAEGCGSDRRECGGVEPNMTKFLDFLHDRLHGGGFTTEDALASLLPLMRQTAMPIARVWSHRSSGVNELQVEGVKIWFAGSPGRATKEERRPCSGTRCREENGSGDHRLRPDHHGRQPGGDVASSISRSASVAMRFANRCICRAM